MIKNIDNLLSKINTLTMEGIVYPKRLLSKFKPDSPFDKEHLGYLTGGYKLGNGYFHWLTLLAKHSEAKLILELGNRFGGSTLAIYHGLQEEQRLITIDTVKDQRYLTEEILSDRRVKLILGDCLDLTAYQRSGEDIPLNIDILWSDTIHTCGQISAEFKVYEPLLSDEALIAIDDIRLNDKGKFFNESEFKKFDLTDVCHGNGFGLIHYIRPLFERGKTKEERIRLALCNALEIMTNKYWSVYNDFELIKNRFRNSIFFRALRKIKRIASSRR